MIVKPITMPEKWDADAARPANELVRSLLGVLNGGVRIADQFPGLKLRVAFIPDDGAIKVGPFRSPVAWVLCLRASSEDSPSIAISGAAVYWTMEGPNVVLSAVDNLTGSTKYFLDLLCLEG